MKFFLDTAVVSDIKKANDYSLLDGVTTNPSLVAKTGKPYLTVVEEICQICRGPVSAEVVASDFDGMLAEARAWSKVSKNIVVKIPMTFDGLKVVKYCKAEGIQTNVTLCFSVVQALSAAKAGATFVSPFVGRLDDLGHDGMKLIEEIKAVYENYDFATEILVASIRNVEHVRRAALYGADAATIPPVVFSQLLEHSLTKSGIAKFEVDAKKIPSL